MKAVEAGHCENVPFEVPEAWEWTTLGEIFTLQAGKNIAAANIHTKQTDKYNFQCYGGNGIRGYVEVANRKGNYPIIGRQGALCGNINLARGEFYATEHAVVVERYDKTDLMWSYYMLTSLNLNQYATATAQPGLAVNIINEVYVPLPPYAEQIRISTEVRQLFSLIDIIENGKESLKCAVKQAKAKILELAIHGKLVPQDPADEPASDLLRRIREEKERLIKEGKIKKEKKTAKTSQGAHSDTIPFEVPESWEWTIVGEISKSILYGVSESAKPTGAYKLLRITDIQNNFVNWVTVPFTDYDKTKAEEYLLNNGDILFARTGATVGKSYLVKGITTKAIYASYLIRVQVYNAFLPEYVKFFFESNYTPVRVSMTCINYAISLSN